MGSDERAETRIGVADKTDPEDRAEIRSETTQVLPGEEITLGDPYHLSKAARVVLASVSVVLVITMTGLFLAGVIQW
jgi:hypothetical protein